jgi:hypothetical protein
MARNVSRIVLNVLTSLGLATTLVAFIWPLFFTVDVGLMILTALLISTGHFVLTWALREPRRGSEDDRVSLERNTVDFADYYREFYELEGSLAIFCEDTEWLEGDIMKPVVEAIAAKGSRATMFLSVLGEPITDDLENRKVKIVKVPIEFALAVKMSYRMNGNDHDLMIRGAGDGTSPVPKNSKKAKEINTFTRTRNQDIVNLAHAVFSAIEKPGLEAPEAGKTSK